MLPPTNTFRPDSRSICAKRVVVVVFPLVPVTAMIGVRMKREASSISPMTGIPLFTADSAGAIVWGTPGLRTIRSAFSKDAGSCRPSSSRISSSRISETRASSRLSSAMSVIVTRALRFFKKRATAAPLLARPTIKMCLSATFIPDLSQF